MACQKEQWMFWYSTSAHFLHLYVTLADVHPWVTYTLLQNFPIADSKYNLYSSISTWQQRQLLMQSSPFQLHSALSWICYVHSGSTILLDTTIKYAFFMVSLYDYGHDWTKRYWKACIWLSMGIKWSSRKVIKLYKKVWIWLIMFETGFMLFNIYTIIYLLCLSVYQSI